MALWVAYTLLALLVSALVARRRKQGDKEGKP